MTRSLRIRLRPHTVSGGQWRDKVRRGGAHAPTEDQLLREAGSVSGAEYANRRPPLDNALRVVTCVAR